MVERVVDPAQVPLAGRSRGRRSRPPRVMLGRAVESSANISDPGVVLVDLAVEPLEEGDGRQVLVAAEPVGLPLPGLREKSSRIIASTPSTRRPSK